MSEMSDISEISEMTEMSVMSEMSAMSEMSEMCEISDRLQVRLHEARDGRGPGPSIGGGDPPPMCDGMLPRSCLHSIVW